MKKYPAIKWSEAAKRGITMQPIEVQGAVKGKEWFHVLPSTTRYRIDELKKIPKEKWRAWHKELREKEWKKANL